MVWACWKPRLGFYSLSASPLAKRGFWLGARMKSVGKAPVCEETPLRISAALGKVLAADVLSCVSPEIWAFQDALGEFCSLEKAL